MVRREIAREGRSRAWLNQAPVTLAALRELGALLVDVHGQHEHQSLLRSEAQRDLLDRWAGLGETRATVAAAHEEARSAEAALASFAEEERHYRDEADAWAFAHDELVAAALRRGEDEELAARLTRLRHAGRLTQALVRAHTAIEGGEPAGGGMDGTGEGDARARGAGDARARAAGALRLVAEAGRALREAAAIDETLAPLAAELEGAASTLAETSRALELALDPAELDPAAAEASEARHALLERLSRKYRRTLGELVAYREELAVKLARGRDSAAVRERLEAAASEARGAYDSAAGGLTKRRRAAARKLEKALPVELAALGLGAAAITVALAAAPVPGPEGVDRVELVFAPNAGEEPRPLARIASGGELSRVMLALKTLLAEEDGVDLLLFDEVDSGIGGAVARTVGERLARLGHVRQVLLVTHLPVIACQAQRQFRIAKLVREGRTHAHVERVEGEARVGEIARMLAGDAATDTTRRQARELLELSG